MSKMRRYCVTDVITMTTIALMLCGSTVFLTGMVTGETILRIGAIADGNNTVVMETFSVSASDYDVIVTWHYIDIRETYQIFRSVRLLDADETVDVIMLFDVEPAMSISEQLLATKNKDLISWGEIPAYSNQIPTEPVSTYPGFGSPDLCADGIAGIPTAYLEDPYCLTDINSTRDDVNGTFNESVTVNAPSVLTTLVSSERWKSIFIIHENATEREANKLSQKLSQSGVLFVIYNVDLIDNLSEKLQEAYSVTMRMSQHINFVVLCRFSCARNVLRTANKCDTQHVEKKTLLKQLSRWLVAVYGHTVGVSRVLQNCANDLDNVVIIAFPEYKSGDIQWFRTAVKKMLWRLVEESVEPAVATETAIARLKQEAASWDPALKCKAFKIDTLLWTSTGREFSTVGFVELSGRLVVQSELFPNVQYGYNKRLFVVSTLAYDPFVMKKVVNGSTVYEGFCMDLLRQLSLTLNFTFTLVEPADGKWGATTGVGNSSWNGLIGQLQNKEVDMVAAPISTMPEREAVMDFTYPYYYDFTTVIVKKPDPMQTKWRTLIDPFRWQVLVAIIAALPVMTFLIFLIEKYNPYYDQPEHAEARELNGGLHSYQDALWYMYGALLCQGGVHLPESFAGRTISSCWWLFSIIIVGIYCGNLIAYLTVTKDKPPFLTVAEMVEQRGSFKWGTSGGTYWEFFFLNSEVPEFKKVGRGLVEFNRTDRDIMSPDNAVQMEKVKGGGYAWIGDKTAIEKMMANECDLVMLQEEFLSLKYALGFPNNSPHTMKFSQELLSIHEGGLFQIWKRRWWPKANFCRGETTTVAKQITIVDVQSAFYVTVIGIVLGTICLCAEIAVAAFVRYRAKRNPKPPLPPVIYNKKESLYRTGSESKPDSGSDVAPHCNGGPSASEINGNCLTVHRGFNEHKV